MKFKSSIAPAAALMIMLMGCSCGSNKSSGTTTPAAQPEQTGLSTTSVRITNSDGTSYTVTAEVAATQQQQATGLMYRTSLADDSAMLFVFSQPQALSFWMKNTYITLDMIFLDQNKIIVDINKNAQPLSETVYTSAQPAKYALEVNGGWCEERNVKVGDRAYFDGY